MITGPAAAWLESRRHDLNQRYARARRRFPAISQESVSLLLADVLPGLAGPEPASGDLLSAAYDLILLHAGRETFARPGTGALLSAIAEPHVRRLLLERPSLLPGALSNAVENLGARGVAFVEAIAAAAPRIPGAEALLHAGAVLAWRLGEARLREAALRTADSLPGRLLLDLLGLADWPEAAAPLALASLRADGWLHPRERVSEPTLRSLDAAAPASLASLAGRLAAPRPAPLGQWTRTARVGDFAGFGGTFEMPPLLLSGGDRHRFFARSLDQDFSIDADVFGWVSRPHARLDLPVRAVAPPASALRRMAARLTSQAPSGDRLEWDGTLAIGGATARLPLLARSTSFVLAPRLVAASGADSHRIRIAVPSAEPV